MQERISRLLGQKVVSMTPVVHGYDQDVFIVKTESDTVVVKRPRKDGLLFRQRFCLEQLSDTRFARVLCSDDEFLVESFIPGCDLMHCDLSMDAQCAVFAEVGSLVRSLHAVALDGYGDIVLPGKGAFSSMRAYVDSWYASHVRLLPCSSAVDAYVQARWSLLEGPGVLVHDDISLLNIRVLDGKLSGIIDFGDAKSAPFASEFATLYMATLGDERFSAVVSGYGGDVDVDTVRFFTVLRLVWFLTGLSTSLDTKKHDELLQLLQEIVRDGNDGNEGNDDNKTRRSD